MVAYVEDMSACQNFKSFLAYLPEDISCHLAYPSFFTMKAQKHLKSVFPGAELVEIAAHSSTRSILAEIVRRMVPADYDAVLWLQASNAYGSERTWLLAQMRGVLGSPERVERIREVFGCDSRVALAAARRPAPFGSSEAPELSCFWVRGALLTQLSKELTAAGQAKTGEEGSEMDENRRLIAAELREMAAEAGKSALLLDTLNLEKDSLHRLEDVEEPSVTLKNLEEIANLPEPIGRIALFANQKCVRGWAAVLGDPAPREIEIRFNENVFTLVADQFRADLRDTGINDGHHGFTLPIAPDILKKASGQVMLLDKATGSLLWSLG